MKKIDMSDQCSHEDDDKNLIENCPKCLFHDVTIGCTDEIPKIIIVREDFSGICDFNDENSDNNCIRCTHSCWPIGCMFEESMNEEENCLTCKRYDSDMPSFEEGGEFWETCRATNNGNLKNFPFKNKLKCYEKKEVRHD